MSKDFEKWVYSAVDLQTGLPLITRFLHKVCGGNHDQFGEGVKVLEAAFEAGRLATADK